MKMNGNKHRTNTVHAGVYFILTHENEQHWTWNLAVRMDVMTAVRISMNKLHKLP